jgi:uncharacterized protein (TIGR02001 family)
MKKYIAITAITTASALMMGNSFAQTAPAAEVKPDPGPVTANVTLASEYRYRGLAQTNSSPAIQGGFDYAHESGFYIGNWNSSISWISDAQTSAGTSSQIEMDFYAGYKKEVMPGLTLDGGALQYYYPTKGMPSTYINANTTEVYVAATYDIATLKYSYALTNLFGTADSSGASYTDLTLNYDTGWMGVTLNGHVGYQYVPSSTNSARTVATSYSYTDWKLGITKDLGYGMNLAIAYIGTNANIANYVNPQGKNLGRGTGFISLTKTF